MTRSRLLCMGDLHLGAGPEYGRKPGDRLADQADVLGRIAGLAIEHGVDGILIAGDTFDRYGTPEQQEVLARFIAACRTARIPVLAVTGNGIHDGAMRDTNGMAIFDHIDGIHVSSRPEVRPFAGCAVATLPWVHPGRLIAQTGRTDTLHDDVAGLLVDIAAQMRAECERSAPVWPTILLAHWSVSGASLPNGLPTDQLREPVIPAEALDEAGFDHVVLGHIHRAQTVGERGFYVGSPMPLNFGEADSSHGVCILHTGEREEIDFPAAEYVEVESRAFVTLDYDVETVQDEPMPAFPDGAIVRVRYRATADQQRSIDTAGWRRALLAAGAAMVKLQPEIVREQRARVQGVDETVDEQAALAMWIAANGVDEDTAAWMRDRLTAYLGAAA